MALPATLTFEVRTTGNDNNSGSFNAQGATPGTDRSQQDSPHVTIDGVTITAAVHTTTTQINLTGFTVSSADIRNTLRIISGTATAGLYEITAVDTVNNRWTVDRSAGASAATITAGRMGGAVKSPGIAASTVHNLGGWIWVKAGTYQLSSTANVADGKVQLSGSGAQRAHMEGYTTTRGDRGGRPVLQASGNTYILHQSIFGVSTIVHIEFDANTHTSISGASGDVYIDCVFRGCATGANIGTYIRCQAIDCNNGSGIGFNSATQAWFCYAKGCTTGYNQGNASFSVANACTAAFSNTGAPNYFNCAAFNPTATGFVIGATGCAINCVLFVSSGTLTTGFNNARNTSILNCASGASGGTITTMFQSTGQFEVDARVPAQITLTANPFTDPTNGDFSLNNTAGGGALLRAAGFPTTLNWSATANSMDIGPMQVAAAAATTYDTALPSHGLGFAG